LVICNNILEILAASLFTVYLVKPGIHVSGETIESEFKIKEMKICVAIEIQ
jgi:hypothetical protein